MTNQGIFAGRMNNPFTPAKAPNKSKGPGDCAGPFVISA
jgi:hypothetical protein